MICLITNDNIVLWPFDTTFYQLFYVMLWDKNVQKQLVILSSPGQNVNITREQRGSVFKQLRIQCGITTAYNRQKYFSTFWPKGLCQESWYESK